METNDKFIACNTIAYQLIEQYEGDDDKLYKELRKAIKNINKEYKEAE